MSPSDHHVRAQNFAKFAQHLVMCTPKLESCGFTNFYMFFSSCLYTFYVTVCLFLGIFLRKFLKSNFLTAGEIILLECLEITSRQENEWLSWTLQSRSVGKR